MSPSFTVIALAARDPRDSEAWLARLDRAIRRSGRAAEIVYAISDCCPALQEALAARQRAGARFELVTLTHWYDEAAAVQAGLARTGAPDVLTVQAGTALEGEHIIELLAALERADVALPQSGSRPLLDALSTHLFGVGPGLAGRRLRACRRTALERVADRSVAFPLFDWYALWQGLRVEAVPLAGLRLRHGPFIGLRAGVSLLFLYALLDFAKRPLRLFGLCGVLAFAFGLALTLPPVIERLVHGQALADDPVLLPGLLLTALGIQCGVIGLVAELLVSVRSHLLGDAPVTPAGR